MRYGEREELDFESIFEALSSDRGLVPVLLPTM